MRGMSPKRPASLLTGMAHGAERDSTAPVKGRYLGNVTPVTGRVFCEVPRSSTEDIELALDAAHAAKAAWVVHCGALRPKPVSTAYSVFIAPRMFIAARPTCNAMSAMAPSCQPQAIHIALLTRNTQNPMLRRFSFDDATSQEAVIVTAMAGHCSKLKISISHY